MMADPVIEALIDEHYSPLLLFVRGRSRVQQDAEDIVQEAWMRSMSAIASGTVSNVRAYLHRVARNLLTDQGHRQLRSGEIVVEESVLLSFPDPRINTEAKLLLTEELRRINAAIQAMPPRSRTVFVLARMEQLSYAEIGRKLNISRQTVYEHMMRAMLVLQAASPKK
jgi:RNA polymerase sigma-70 factor (ECF subfamily)